MFVTHLESALDGTQFPPNQLATMHKDRPLWVRYDLPAIAANVSPKEITTRIPSLWRYRELLPLPANCEPVTLGEGLSPILPCRQLGKEMGLSQLFIKDESQLPTGSFKSRGMSAAVSMAKHFGLKRLAIPTAGNAGGALAAYGARAGMEVFVFMSADTPAVNKFEAALFGAKVFLVNGLITDCGRIVRQGVAEVGWFDVSTLKEPYRLEGKKTMGIEIAEQWQWKLPDAILYPTGGGTGLIGMWKAFNELAALGWLTETKMPRLYSCQSESCAPIVLAFRENKRFAEPFPNARTQASGLRVPAAVGDFMILDAIRQSGGAAIAGREDRIEHWMHKVAAAEGVSICPETAIAFDCLSQLVADGTIMPSEEVVVFNTGAAQKYVDTVAIDLPVIDKDQPVHYRNLIND